LEKELVPQIKIEDSDDMQDGSSEIPVEMINVLRKRTFNPELRKLVNQISTHDEPESTGEDKESDITAFNSKKELILSLHKLFYMVKFADDSAFYKNSPDFFDKIYNDNDIDFDSFFLDLTDKQLTESFSCNYALLTYDFNRKCYIVKRNKIPDLNIENIVIGLQDKLYKDLRKNQKGIVLNPAEIENDPFLKKKFQSDSGNNVANSLYFIFTGNLTQELHARISTESHEDNQTIYPLPILLMSLENDKYETVQLFSRLTQMLAIPLYLLENPEARGYETSYNTDFSQIISLLDSFMQMSKNYNGTCFIVKLTSFSNQNILLMKYLYTKICNLLTDDSFVIRMSIDRILIVVRDREVGLIRNVINEYGSLLEESLSLNVFPSKENESVESLLLNIYF